MKSGALDSFWRGEQLNAAEMLSLQQAAGAFDIDEAQREARCLGTALGLENDAIVLVLVGLQQDARRCFAVTNTLALLAYKSNERYIYEDPDGKNSMAKYMSMRTVALCDFALGNDQRRHHLGTAIAHLEEVIGAPWRGQPLPPSQEVDAVLIAHLALHYAQVERWDWVSQLSTVPMRWRSAKSRLWAETISLLVSTAEGVTDPRSERAFAAEAALDLWFARSTDVLAFRRPLHPLLLGHFMVGMAEIRAKWFKGITDPMTIVSSLRATG